MISFIIEYLLKERAPIEPIHKESTRPESPNWTKQNPQPWPAPVWPTVKKKPPTKFIDQQISLLADKRIKDRKSKQKKNSENKIYCIPLVKLDPQLKKSLRIVDSRGNRISNNNFTVVESVDDIKKTTIANYGRLGKQHLRSFGLQRTLPSVKIDVVPSQAKEVLSIDENVV